MRDFIILTEVAVGRCEESGARKDLRSELI